MASKKTAVTWVLGGVMVASFGSAALVACSGDDTTNNNVLPGVDASKPDTSSVTPDTGVPDTSTPPVDAGPDCAKPPTFHLTPEAGPFCPFQAKLADGGFAPSNCNSGEHCCVYAANSGLPSTCNAAASACKGDAGAADFQCQESGDCANGEVCCLSGSIGKDPACGTYFGSKVNGTACRKSCSADAGEVLVCDGVNSVCPNGQTCQPFKTKSIEMGACTN